MDIIKKLNSVGKAVFVKYYYLFRNESNQTCVAAITEPYTLNAKQSRTSSAKAIFREGMQLQALRIISQSSKVDPLTRKQASKIMIDEIAYYITRLN